MSSFIKHKSFDHMTDKWCFRYSSNQLFQNLIFF